MKKRWTLHIGAALLAAALLAGCGGAASGAAADSAAPEMNYFSTQDSVAESPEGMDMDLGGGLESGLDPGAVTDRKMVYTANVYLESKIFDEARAALGDAVTQYGGYIEYTSLDGDAENGNRYLNYTARIPVDNYTAFIAAVGEVGNVTSFSENAEDITSSYIDVEARLAALEAQRDRLNELAERAETTADLIEIESRLSDVQYELENYTRQMKSMDERVAYSTVDLTLCEVHVYTPVTHTFADRIIDAFFSGWRGFRDFFEGLAVFLVEMLPFILLAGVIFVIVRAATAKGRAERKAARAAAKAARQAAKNAPTPQNPDDAPKPKY